MTGCGRDGCVGGREERRDTDFPISFSIGGSRNLLLYFATFPYCSAAKKREGRSGMTSLVKVSGQQVTFSCS